jgi:KRAB domain-containing zinc finger protein
LCTHPGCGKTFAFRDGLLRHKATVHNNERPHVCHVCSKTFKQQSHLNKHMRSAIHQRSSPGDT